MFLRLRHLLCPILLLLMLPAGSALAARGAAPEPQRIFEIGNIDGVENGASAPSIFTTTQPWHLVQIGTYHWNDGKGTSSTGTIRLKGLGGAKSYGPFKTSGQPGQGGVPNAYWNATVDFDLPAGRYQIIDSSPGTWAQNDASGHRGMTWVVATPGAAGPPKVVAFQRSGIVYPASGITLGYSVTDASGKAEVHIALYDGGALDTTDDIKVDKANGSRLDWNVDLAADLKGPLYFCVWAENAAGEKSARAPRSACKFISMLVDIAKVSNGCGGEGWPSVVAAENYMGNTTTYEEPEGGSYTVSFIPACNLHDAGYGGQTVADAINGDTVDYHTWSRKRVDDKFQRDMWAICRRRIPPSAKTALRSCIRDVRRYTIVRVIGMKFFDYDLMKEGTQGDGPRS